MEANPEKEVKKFLRGMRWAITSTNFIGMPLLLPVIGIILHFNIGHIIENWNLDFFFFISNLAIIVVVALFFVELHFELMSRVRLSLYGFKIAEIEPVDLARLSSCPDCIDHNYISLLAYMRNKIQQIAAAVQDANMGRHSKLG